VNQTIANVFSLFFVFALLLFVSKFSLADYYFAKADSDFKLALTLDEPEKSNSFNQALYHLENSSKYRTRHAEALDLKGEIYYRLWWLNPDGRYLTDSNLLQKSKALHLQALQERQEWPYTMLQLAKLEAHKPFLDQDFYFRFDQAYQFGRYETSIGLELMKLGILRWQQLDIESRKKVIDLTHIAVQQKRNNLNDIKNSLETSDLFDYMCVNIEKTPRQNDLCGLSR